MQKISEILNSPTAPAETGARASSRPTTSDAGNWIWSNDERLAGRPGVPEPVPCEFCGALRYHKGIQLGNRILWPPYGAERCTCPEAVAAYEKAQAEREAAEAAAAKAEEEKKMRDRIKRIVGESGMGDRFLRRTFSTFQLTDDNKRAAAAARRYAEGFDAMLPQPGRQEPGRNGLFIAGKPVICMTMIDLLERIKRTYSTTGGSESDVLKIYKTVPLLVIDDIGKEPPTEWAISTVYNIINGRYEAYLPTIVTTNYDTEALIDRMTPRESRASMTARATIDRLMEMCRDIYLTQFMDDNVPEERELALKIGSELVLGCSELWAFGIDHPSAGMAAEIELAKAHGIPVRNGFEAISELKPDEELENSEEDKPDQHLDHGPISIELDGSVILELADRLISDPGVHIEIGG